MKTRIHDGIVFTKICEKYFLVAMKSAWADCPRIQEINEYAAFCWPYFESDSSEREMINAIVKEYGINEYEAEDSLNEFIEQLKRYHLMVDKE